MLNYRETFTLNLIKEETVNRRNSLNQNLEDSDQKNKLEKLNVGAYIVGDFSLKPGSDSPDPAEEPKDKNAGYI